MSHRIIIDHTSEDGQLSVTTTYTPPHTETPEMTGMKVTRILRNFRRLGGDTEDGD